MTPAFKLTGTLCITAFVLLDLVLALVCLREHVIPGQRWFAVFFGSLAAIVAFDGVLTLAPHFEDLIFNAAMIAAGLFLIAYFKVLRMLKSDHLESPTGDPPPPLVRDFMRLGLILAMGSPAMAHVALLPRHSQVPGIFLAVVAFVSATVIAYAALRPEQDQGSSDTATASRHQDHTNRTQG